MKKQINPKAQRIDGKIDLEIRTVLFKPSFIYFKLIDF